MEVSTVTLHGAAEGRWWRALSEAPGEFSPSPVTAIIMTLALVPDPIETTRPGISFLSLPRVIFATCPTLKWDATSAAKVAEMRLSGHWFSRTTALVLQKTCWR
jgi:hypothetical protein